MSASAQINVRLDPAVKAAGDEALASIGLSPSQAVRLVWERASRRGEGLEQIRQLALDDRDGEGVDRANGLKAGRLTMQRALRSLGLDRTPLPRATDEDLLEQELVEHAHQACAGHAGLSPSPAVRDRDDSPIDRDRPSRDRVAS